MKTKTISLAQIERLHSLVRYSKELMDLKMSIEEQTPGSLPKETDPFIEGMRVIRGGKDGLPPSEAAAKPARRSKRVA